MELSQLDMVVLREVVDTMRQAGVTKFSVSLNGITVSAELGLLDQPAQEETFREKAPPSNLPPKFRRG